MSSSSASSSASSSDDDERFSDWESPTEHAPFPSLFSDQVVFTTLDTALAHDKEHHGFDFTEYTRKLGIKGDEKIRFVNWVRGTKPSLEILPQPGDDKREWHGEEWMKAVREDDPYLLETWSDSDSSDDDGDEISRLRGQMEAMRSYLLTQPTTTPPKKPERESAYFSSYGQTGIHYTMLSDKVRTSSYAQFILSNPQLFADRVVLDLGAGSGILSLFAARAGAKKVWAIEASKLASKTREVAEKNGFSEVIEVVESRIEDPSLDEKISAGSVDVIISEWMGYALLYESMLPSLLSSRRFLVPDAGLLVPSETSILLSPIAAPPALMKEQIGFWDDVYGFDLSPLISLPKIYSTGIVTTVPAEALLSSPAEAPIVRSLHLASLTKEEGFGFRKSAFSVTIASDQKRIFDAWVLWFDVFFTRDGEPLPANSRGKVVHGDTSVGDVFRPPSRPKPERRVSSKSIGEEPFKSFTTSPESEGTHWEQVVLLVSPPHPPVSAGDTITGWISMSTSEKKADDDEDMDHRELEIVMHWVVNGDQESGRRETWVIK